MAKRHIRLKEDGWRVGLLINGGGAVATGVVTIVIAITKFAHGAWAVMLLVPVLVAVLVRLNRQYKSEAAELGGGVAETIAAPVPANHVSVVMIDKLDAAAARALRVARTLRTDRTEAVHIAVDEHRADLLANAWSQARPDHVDLRIIEAADRKLDRKAMEYVLELLADGRTQVSVLIPRLLHRRAWHRLLHDRTAERLASSLSKLPNVNVTFIPFHLGGEPTLPGATIAELVHEAQTGSGIDTPTNGNQPIGSLEWRQTVSVVGRIEELAIETVRGTPSLVAVIADGTGKLDLLFLGRPRIGGVQLGAVLKAEGMAASHRGRLTIINPVWEFVAPAPHHAVSPNHD
jgi:hypothetical protein